MTNWFLLLQAQTQSRPFDFMTREVFDTLIIAVIIIGSAFAAVRLYRDFTRPLPNEDDQQGD
ncbi:MAG: hypothetical protein Kow00117_05660 [Phototrophicales bacterium]